jgi:hypothetical protein
LLKSADPLVSGLSTDAVASTQLREGDGLA